MITIAIMVSTIRGKLRKSFASVDLLEVEEKTIVVLETLIIINEGLEDQEIV
ncbi:MAG: hypothetical protein ACFFFH_08935 [Candidatus Thorarchaeota archaeon]